MLGDCVLGGTTQFSHQLPNVVGVRNTNPVMDHLSITIKNQQTGDLANAVGVRQLGANGVACVQAHNLGVVLQVFFDPVNDRRGYAAGRSSLVKKLNNNRISCVDQLFEILARRENGDFSAEAYERVKKRDNDD